MLLLVRRLALVAGLVPRLLLAAGCEDSRPPAAPRFTGERESLVRAWNSLEARLEEDNTSKVRAKLDTRRSAELDAAVTRASASLHEAHRVLETLSMNFPEEARAAQFERAHQALDEAAAAVEKADAIRESLDGVEAGAPPPAAPDAASP